LRSLEMCEKFEAGYLVLHMGSVPMKPKKWTKKLTSLLGEGRQHDKAFLKHKVAFVRKREKVAPLYYQRALEALESLAERAQELGVKLAVESRSRYEDVPSEREMLQLQQHFADHPAIGYWHDFGHVQLKHNLGLLDHQQWLESVSRHLVGCHLHDVQWPARDHRVPFQGSIDYVPLLKHIPAELPLVWELSPTRKAHDIRESLKEWRKRHPDHG
ncbi:MAG: TIM barrel protein, partial [Akkermansiaceae bacterium]|nr:TIM barrel protein [Akkermansiaceae bacterium]